MSALDQVRKKFGNLQSGTSKGSKSPSAGSAGSSPKESEKFSPLPPDLERRIRLMARRWEYSRARRDPAAWTRAEALDERRETEFRERGLLPRTDA